MDQFHKRSVGQRVHMLFRWIEVCDEVRREVELTEEQQDHLLPLESYLWDTLKSTVYSNIQEPPTAPADDIPF